MLLISVCYCSVVLSFLLFLEVLVTKRKVKFLNGYVKSCNNVCTPFGHVAQMNLMNCIVQQLNVFIIFLFCCIYFSLYLLHYHCE